MAGQLPKSSAEAFAVNGEIANVLMIHGYTGTPYDFLYLSQRLHQHGFGVHAPLLSGHGSEPDAINAVPAQQWIDDTERALAQMPSDKPIFVAGLSMGALLATLLASKHPQQIQGLILLAPAFRLRLAGRIAVALARLGLYHLRSNIIKSDGVCETADAVAKRLSPAYAVIPIKGLIQLDVLRGLALSNAVHVQCPVFAGLASLDHTVDVAGTKQILEHFFASQVEIEEFRHSQHVLSLDIERDEVADAISSFCRRLTSSIPKIA